MSVALALAGMLSASCSSSGTLLRPYDPCPGALVCPNMTCCPVGTPFECNDKCYATAAPCGSTYVTCSGSNDSAGGGTSRSLTCDQTCQDHLSGWALDDTMWLIYNENVAGQPSGSVDRTASCPLGGSVHITGSKSVTTDGTVTLHLTFDFVNCSNSASTFSLGFTGSVAVNGTFNGTGASKFTSVTLTSSSLAISGSLKVLDDPPITETCDVTVTQQDSSGGSQSLDGRVCGREFSSAATVAGSGGATGGGGTGGATGTGGGGASGGACTCYCGWPANTKCTQPSDCPNDTSIPGTNVPGVCGKPVGCSACTP